jgi:hypothetical protein
VATEEESFDTFSLTLFPLARKKGENKKTEKKKKSVVSFFKGVQCANFTIKKKLSHTATNNQILGGCFT